MTELKRNDSGYLDPTAEKALRKIDKDNEKHEELLKHIFYVCNLAGFQIEGRIVLRDRKTGRVWR